MESISTIRTWNVHFYKVNTLCDASYVLHSYGTSYVHHIPGRQTHHPNQREKSFVNSL
jgi:hypothetical protein